MKKLLCALLLWTGSFLSIQAEPPAPIPLTSITEADLKEFHESPPEVKKLIREALRLATLKLKYLYGSADPANGGVDCSGTIHYLLKEVGLTGVPRDASGFYEWSWKQDRFHSVISTDPASFEFKHLRPGDLLFWIGTYDVKRDPPISHVMLYLGTHAVTHERLMMGASSSQSFKGTPHEAVTVSTWNLARQGQPGARFIGYGSIPGLVAQPADDSKAPRPATVPPSEDSFKIKDLSIHPPILFPEFKQSKEKE